MQGQKDTLFNIQEALATYRSLSAKGVPTAMIWFSGGHSGTPAAGDYSSTTPNPDTQYVTQRAVGWLDH